MSGWQLRRSKGPLLVLASLALGVALMDLLVSTTLGWDSFGGQEQTQTFSRLEQASAKVAALRAATQSGTRVGLVLGVSTADWGVDLRLLERETHLRWAKVTGEFSSFTNLAEVVRRFDGPGVEANQTLLCVHYGMLLGARRQKTTRLERLAQIRERTGQTRSSSDVARLVTLSWLGNNRAGAANRVELSLGAQRARLLGRFGQSDEIIYPSLADPFEDTPNQRKAMHPSVRARHVAQAAERWRLVQADASKSDQTAQAAALSEMVGLLGRRPGLVVVLMPEHSALRAVVPEAFARKLLDEALAASGRSPPPPVLDLRAGLPDEYFADAVHATAEGRPKLTDALARTLALSEQEREP